MISTGTYHWTNREEELLIEHVRKRTPREMLYSIIFKHRTMYAIERRIADLRKAGRIPQVGDCDPAIRPKRELGR